MFDVAVHCRITLPTFSSILPTSMTRIRDLTQIAVIKHRRSGPVVVRGTEQVGTAHALDLPEAGAICASEGGGADGGGAGAAAGGAPR